MESVGIQFLLKFAKNLKNLKIYTRLLTLCSKATKRSKFLQEIIIYVLVYLVWEINLVNLMINGF
jgi:hypothetical protein